MFCFPSSFFFFFFRFHLNPNKRTVGRVRMCTRSLQKSFSYDIFCRRKSCYNGHVSESRKRNPHKHTHKNTLALRVATARKNDEQFKNITALHIHSLHRNFENIYTNIETKSIDSLEGRMYHGVGIVLSKSSVLLLQVR